MMLNENNQMKVVVIISSGAEWRETKKYFAPTIPNPNPSPVGEFLQMDFLVNGKEIPLIILHGGWGKVPTAASTQYAIDRWNPTTIINLGTCGGIQGFAKSGEILMIEKVVAYDIEERMQDPEEAIARFSTDIDLSWINELQKSLPTFSEPVRRAILVSGDRDLNPSEVTMLQKKYSACAGDWESGAIAWVATKNQVRCLILRGVSDIVGANGGEALGDGGEFYYKAVPSIMKRLLNILPEVLAVCLS